MKAIGKRESVMSALDWALQQDDTEQRRDDEFTVDDYIARKEQDGVYLSKRAARDRLDALIRKKKIKKRKISVNGCFRNVYSKA